MLDVYLYNKLFLKIDCFTVFIQRLQTKQLDKSCFLRLVIS